MAAYSSTTGQQLKNWVIGSQLGAVDVSLDGRYVVSTEQKANPVSNGLDISVYRLDTITGVTQTFTYRAIGYAAPFADISFLANGKILLTQSFPGSGWVPLTTLDPATGSFVLSAQSYAQDGTLNATPDDRFVVFTPQNISDAPIYYYISGTGITAKHDGYADNVMGYNRGVQAISPSGNLIVQGVGQNVYNASLKLQFSLHTLYPELGDGGFGTRGFAFSPDETKLYVLDSGQHKILVLSTTDWSLIAGYNFNVLNDMFSATNPYGDALTASQDGRYLSVMGSNGVEIIDLTKIVSVPGTSGNDTISSDDHNVYSYAGNDIVVMTGDNWVVRAGAGDDTIRMAAQVNGYGSYYIIDGGTGDDTLDLSGLTGMTATSTANGFNLALNTYITFAVSGIEHVQLGGGNDSFALSNNDLSTIEIRGGGGNDTRQGGPNMTLWGEGGNDVFLLGSGTGAPSLGTIDGGTGIDRIELNAGFTVDLALGIAGNGVAHYTVTGVEDVSVTVGGTAAVVKGDANANSFTVNPFFDTGAAGVSFYGYGGDDFLTGSAGHDFLSGGAGNDRLDGGAGADIMGGGVGDDTYYVDDVGDVINETAGEGYDRVFATISYSLSGRQLERLELLGDANIDATGNSLDNTLVGNSGNNVLNGLGGADAMVGGAGDDIYYVDNVGDRVIEQIGGGIDTVLSTISWSIAGLHLENLTLRGTANIDGGGNSLANIIVGNNGTNTLNGLTGDDELHGGLGSDILIGGGGLDKFVFDTAIGKGDIDSIVDFTAADDQIGLARSIFTALAPGGVLAAEAFVAGTAALGGEDRIIYNKVTGGLFYDADGSGAEAMIQFARLKPGTAIAAEDFYIL